jgi:hypothetical protein
MPPLVNSAFRAELNAERGLHPSVKHTKLIDTTGLPDPEKDDTERDERMAVQQQAAERADATATSDPAAPHANASEASTAAEAAAAQALLEAAANPDTNLASFLAPSVSNRVRSFLLYCLLVGIPLAVLNLLSKDNLDDLAVLLGPVGTSSDPTPVLDDATLRLRLRGLLGRLDHPLVSECVDWAST